MFGELKDSMDRMNKGTSSLGKRMDSLLEVQSQPREAGESLERSEKNIDAISDVLNRLEQICEEEGNICETTASEREELRERMLVALDLREEPSSQ